MKPIVEMSNGFQASRAERSRRGCGIALFSLPFRGRPAEAGCPVRSDARRRRVGAVLQLTHWARILIALIFISPLFASASTDTGLAWLTAQQNADGSFGSSGTSLATPVQSTDEVLRAFQALGQQSQAGYTAAFAYLNGDAEANTEYLARKIIVNAREGNDVNALVNSLAANHNPDGGFGNEPGDASSVLDTAYALKALASANYNNSQFVGTAVSYLLSTQTSAGGWADGANTPSVFVSAQAMRALWFYRSNYAAVPTALTNAQNFLLTQRDSTGVWSDQFDTALALLAIVPNVTDLSLVNTSMQALSGAQLADGSWEDDPYTTALGLQAETVYQARQVGGTGTGGTSGSTTSTQTGSLSGSVVVAGSTEPLGGVLITITELPGTRVQTNGAGNFVFSSLPVGTYTLTASKSGYSSASVVATVQGGQTTIASTIALSNAAENGVVAGTIFDAKTQGPIAGATITLTGGMDYSAVTGSNGTFTIASITPGDYSVTVAATGYSTVTGSISVVAGQTLTLNQGMTPAGGYVDSSPGTLTGTVVDGSTGQPLAGATFDLGNGFSATTDGSGQFSIASVTRGSYTGTLSASGYVTRTFSVFFPAGAPGTLGTLALYAQSPATAPTSLTLHGIVVDGLSRAPIAGATVNLVDTGATAVTGADGTFVFSGITSKNFTLSTTAVGYATNTLPVSVSAFGQASITVAMPPPPSAAGSDVTLEGTITDASNGTPIPNAHISVDGTSLYAMSDANGHYSLAGITTLQFKVTVAAVGYASLSGAAITLSDSGIYVVNPKLQPIPIGNFDVVSVTADKAQWGSDQTATFTAQIVNTVNVSQNALVIGEVVNASGTSVGTLIPYAQGTTTPMSSYTFAPNETKTLTIPWATAQLTPGTYTIIVRVVEPGTPTALVPLGQVLAENQAYGTLIATSAISGALGINPPLTQAGSSTPVSLSAIIRNDGNVLIPAGNYQLKITDSTGATVDYTTEARSAAIAVGANTAIEFGTWVPTATGNLKVSVASADSAVPGTVTGTLYIGNKPTGTFTLDKTVVPEGTQTVHGRIAMQGVDITKTTSVDPLYPLVKDALRRGDLYTGTAALNWQSRYGCLGCHIQNQALFGMASSIGKTDVNLQQLRQLFNLVSTAQNADGTIYTSYPWNDLIQTYLGMWSLSAWPDPQETFRERYKAASYVYRHAYYYPGGRAFWVTADPEGWWSSGLNRASPVNTTGLVVYDLASLVSDSRKLEMTKVKDYGLAPPMSLAQGANPEDIEVGPDGAFYVVQYKSGTVVRYDPDTGVTTTVASGMPQNSISGLAFAADGTMYVCGNGFLRRINADGTGTNVITGHDQFMDVEKGPDGWLYISDRNANRILRYDPSTGATEVYVAGGLIDAPFGLSFDAKGNLWVANFVGHDILKVSPDREVSVFGGRLGFWPYWLDSTADGTLYCSGLGPNKLIRMSPDGLAESLISGPVLRGVSVKDGDVYIGNAPGNTIQKLLVQPLDTSQIPQFLAGAKAGARYLLGSYQDNTPDNVTQAIRLIGLASARQVMAESTLRSQIDKGISNEEKLLRSRQRADGGWPKMAGRDSDPLVTAMVGIALDYTNPSPDDPQFREAVQFLLNTQGADGSWPNVSNGFTTRLASTSFIMAFLPKALDRLGGIDVNLHVDVPSNVQLANPSLAPTSTTPDASGGGTSYDWKLEGVTSAGRNVDFDLTLPDLALNETRPVATSAYMAFKNSFTGETMKVPLTIPSVHAASGLSLTVATDKPGYDANEDVTITAPVSNTGATTASGEVDLSIRAAGTTTALVTLPPQPVTDLASGASVPVAILWNTGTTLAGDYEVDARLIDSQGRLAAEATAPFVIAAPNLATPATSVHTDKPVYQSWDTVQIAGRVQNTAANALLSPTDVVLTVKSPSGSTLLSETRALGQLAPLALRDLAFTMNLADAPAGTYPVILLVRDDFTHDVLSVSSTSFQVVRNDLQAVGGNASVDKSKVYQGDPDSCTDTAKDLSATDLTGVTLTHQLVSMDSQKVLDEQTEIVDLTAGGAGHSYTRDIDSGQLALGGYACVLKATINGQSKTVAYAGFKVVPPPIRIDSTMALGHHGRLLVLLDPPRLEGKGDKDHGQGDSHCDDVTAVDMDTHFAHPVSQQATVEVTVTGADGTVLDHEYTPLAGFNGPFNASPGAQGVDLEITDFTADGLGLALVRHPSDPDISTAPVHVEAVIYDGGTSTHYDSGAMPCACSVHVNEGEHHGAFTLGPITHTEAANDEGVTPEQQFLETLLTQAGWSYTIVHNGEAFEHELHTGGYAAYLLLAEKQKLEETTQQELREAVFRGDGLVVAGNHDARDLHEDKLDDALGIKPEGVFPHVLSVQLTTSPLELTDQIDLVSGDQPERMILTTATSAGVYVPDPAYPARGEGDDCKADSGHGDDGHGHGAEDMHGGASDHAGGKGDDDHGEDHDNCAPSLDAVVLNDYGQGKSAYTGFDLLAMAMRDGSGSPAAHLLLKLLDTTHPANPDTHVGSVVPVEITLTNKGIAVPVRVTLPLPAGTAAVDPGDATVSGGNLVWNFPFAKDEVKMLHVWLRLPDTAGDLNLEANVEAQDHSGTWKSYSTPKLTISVLAAPAPADIVAALEQLKQTGTCQRDPLEAAIRNIKDAERDLGKHPDEALHDALKAADELLEEESNPAVAPVRVLLDQWIKVIARNDER